MLNFFVKKPKDSSIRCAITITQEGIWLICINHSTTTSLEVVCKEFIPCENNHREQKRNLKEAVKKLNLLGVDCRWVLQPTQYELLLLTPPKVSAEEINSALKWQISEMSDIPPTESMVEVIKLPTSQMGEVNKMVYVVVTQRKEILTTASLIESCGLKLSIIDIAEMALRNVMALCPEEKEGAMLLTKMGNQFILLSCQGRLLHLSRRISIDYEIEKNNTNTTIQNKNSMLNKQQIISSETNILTNGKKVENLAQWGFQIVEEMQRSFDFSINMLELPIPKNILLYDIPNLTTVQLMLSQNFQQKVSELKPSELIGQIASENNSTQYLLVLGAALR